MENKLLIFLSTYVRAFLNVLYTHLFQRQIQVIQQICYDAYERGN